MSRGFTDSVKPLGVSTKKVGEGFYIYTSDCKTLNGNAFHTSKGFYSGSEGFLNKLPLFQKFVLSVVPHSTDSLLYYSELLKIIHSLIINPNLSSTLQVLIRLRVAWPGLAVSFDINPAHYSRTIQKLEELGMIYKLKPEDVKVNPIVRAIFASRSNKIGQNPLPTNKNFRRLSVHTWVSDEYLNFFKTLFQDLDLFDPVLDQKLSTYLQSISWAVQQHKAQIKIDVAIKSANIDWSLLKETYFCYVKGILSTKFPDGREVSARDWPRLLQQAVKETRLSESEIITKLRQELGLYVQNDTEGDESA